MSTKSFSANRSQLANITIISLFVVVLFLPLVQMIFPLVPKTASNENRKLADPPVFSKIGFRAIRKFQKDLDSYFTDHYGFRNNLVGLNAFVDFRIFGISPNSDVVIGSNGWLFYNSHQESSNLDDYYGLELLKPEELARIKRNISYFNKQLQEKGIQFLVVLAPNKHTIYPEYLPSDVRARKGQKTRADQLADLFSTIDISYIDLRANLLNAKAIYQQPLYYKTDTHWNQLGAFLGYERIVAEVKKRYPELKTQSLADYQIKTSDNKGTGDLAGFIDMRGSLRDENVLLEGGPQPLAVTIVSPYQEHPERPDVAMEIHGKQAPRLLAFRDSFATALIPYLSEGFSRSIYLWQVNVDMSIIDKEKPNVVIFEFVERGYDRFLWTG